MAITGIVGIIAGFISGKNAARSSKTTSRSTRSEVNLKLSLVTILFCGWMLWARIAAFSADFVTKGDIRKSNVEMFKSFFTEEKCDQILIDTFTICYDHERKSPTAVYVEVTGPL